MHFSTYQSVLLAGASLIAGVESSPLSAPKHPSSDHPHFTPGTWPTGFPKPTGWPKPSGFAKPSGFPALPSGFPTGVIPSGGPWGSHPPWPTAFGTGFEKREAAKKSKSSKTKKTKTPKPTAFPTLPATGGVFPTGFPAGSGSAVFPTDFAWPTAFPTGGFPSLPKRAASKSHKTHHAHGTGIPHPTGGFPHPTGGFAKPTGVFPRAADSTPKPSKTHKTHKPKGSGGVWPTGGFPKPTGGAAWPTGGFPFPTGGFKTSKKPKPTKSA